MEIHDTSGVGGTKEQCFLGEKLRNLKRFYAAEAGTAWEGYGGPNFSERVVRT